MPYAVSAVYASRPNTATHFRINTLLFMKCLARNDERFISRGCFIAVFLRVLVSHGTLVNDVIIHFFAEKK